MSRNQTRLDYPKFRDASSSVRMRVRSSGGGLRCCVVRSSQFHFHFFTLPVTIDLQSNSGAGRLLFECLAELRGTLQLFIVEFPKNIAGAEAGRTGRAAVEDFRDADLRRAVALGIRGSFRVFRDGAEPRAALVTRLGHRLFGSSGGGGLLRRSSGLCGGSAGMSSGVVARGLHGERGETAAKDGGAERRDGMVSFHGVDLVWGFD